MYNWETGVTGIWEQKTETEKGNGKRKLTKINVLFTGEVHRII